MAIARPSTNWTSGAAAALNDRVYYNGVGYECTTAITQNSAASTTRPFENSSWRRFAVFTIEDYYSLQDSIEIALNVDDDEINESIPLFIHDAEQAITKRVRSPAQTIIREFTLNSDGSFSIPSDLLNIDHLRFTGTAGTGYSLEDAGKLEILAANKEEYEQLRQLYRANGYYYDNTLQYQRPVYFNDDRNIYITPVPSGTVTVELTYVQEVPRLGTTVGLVNDDYEAINSAGQTVAQWVAAGGSNTEANFVQDTEVVEENLWTSSIPHLLRLGALVCAEAYLKDDQRIQTWRQAYAINLQETIDEFNRFNTNRPHTIQMSSGYL